MRSPSSSSDVVELLRALLRFDTTNRAPGDAEGELAAARWIHDLLTGAGYQPCLLARSDAAHRANVVLRVQGEDPDLDALLVHAHLDVVPAERQQWSTDPFGGEVADGYVHGRGATDMKDMCAMTLAVLLDWAVTGRRPRRDVVVAFVADEETDGAYGAGWLVREHAARFAGVAVAIGESGGVVEEHVSADGSPVRVARIAAGERGSMHVRLTTHGHPGHGSRPGTDNAVLALVDALQRVGHHRWPLHLAPLVRAQLEQTAKALGHASDLETEAGTLGTIEALGPAAGVAAHTVRASTTPTVVRAGYKVNVVPGRAEAEVDVRCPPGFEEQLRSALPGVVGDGVDLEHTVLEPPVQAPYDGPWFELMADAIRHVDPGVVVVPGCMAGGTDAKAFSTLGIDCYGFAPATLDPEGRQRSGIHGVDERVPVASLEGGLRILRHFLENA